LLVNNKRTNRLEWSDEKLQAFENIKLALYNSRKQTFLDGHGEVHL